jgi:hypothetical protein
VNKRGDVSGTNKNGMVNVAFQGGVKKITIKYRTKNRAYAVTHHIYISPISLRPVPPPPPFNEDGLSFVKQVKERDITTCDPVEYSFYIDNANCDPKAVKFSDVLPPEMKWEAGSIGLDAASSDLNPTLATNIYGGSGTLQINDLIVPGASTLIMTATAMLDKDAPTGEYDNRASIVYDRIVNNIPVQQPPFFSLDRETLEEYTSFNAEWQQRLDTVKMTATYVPGSYAANSEIEVTYRVDNPNDAITDMFLDLNFNEEFTFVPSSFVVTQVTGTSLAPAPVCVTPGADDSPSTMIVAGNVAGSTGFTLPQGILEIKYKLKAPALAGIVDERDDADVLTGEKVDLVISYDFDSEMDDPCVLFSIKDLHGEKRIPYSKITHIITNKNTSTKIIK